MKIKKAFFDLYGTLLPLDPDGFVKEYFGGLCKKLAPRGYEPQKLVGSIWKGTAAMVANDGSRTNEQVFWDVFADIYGEEAKGDIEIFDEFYREDFCSIKAIDVCDPKAAETVRALKARGVGIVVATNPIFPLTAQKTRLKKAGIDPSEVEYITSYENSHYCKPNPEYYSEIMRVLGCKAEECVMIGNDVGEDMIAGALGFDVFLLTNCMINTADADITKYDRGGFDELRVWLDGKI